MAIISPPDGAAITTHTIGQACGIPALLIPGGPCRDVEYLEGLANVGSEKPLTVIHPRVTRTTGGLSRGWWNDAEGVIAVADSLGLETFDLIAHSAAQHARATKTKSAALSENGARFQSPYTASTLKPAD